MTDDDKPNITIGLIGTGRANLRALAGEEAMQPAAITHPIHHAPALVGTRGRAWLCDTDAGRAKLAAEGRDVSADATVALWVIEAPWAHPAWHTYGLFLVHLRPISGLEKPIFHLNDATHEMWLYALHPDHDLNDLVATGIGAPRLQPSNFASQFIEISDDLAAERVQRSVQMICDGKLSPDTDWQQAWVDLYGNSMIKREWR